jgi:hypothetical protein
MLFGADYQVYLDLTSPSVVSFFVLPPTNPARNSIQPLCSLPLTHSFHTSPQRNVPQAPRNQQPAASCKNNGGGATQESRTVEACSAPGTTHYSLSTTHHPVSLLDLTLTKNAPACPDLRGVSPVFLTLTKSLDLKSHRITLLLKSPGVGVSRVCYHPVSHFGRCHE